MNICLLTDKYPPDPGGVAISAGRLAQGLAAAGHTVHVCGPSNTLLIGQSESSAGPSGVTVHRFGAARRAEDTHAEWFDHVVALHESSPFDVLHGYYLAGAGFVAAYAGRYLNRPSIASGRGNDVDRAIFAPEKAAHTLWTLANASAITAVSHQLAGKIAALGRPARVIHNAVDSAIFAPRPAAPLDPYGLRTDGLPVIGFVGEARRKKGLYTLLMAGVHRAAEPPIKPALFGGGRPDDAAALEVFEDQRPPNLHISVIPHLNHADLPDLYALLDVLALPSLRDGLPNALLEGMACARPVITTRTGGILDAVTDGVEAVLIAPNDANALMEAIRALLDDPARRIALGQAARRRALTDFAPEREIAANVQLYAELTCR
jgi:glycosyltransferase involved in cell wall biosynthesis